MPSSKNKKRFLEEKRSLASGFALPIGLCFSFLIACHHEGNDFGLRSARSRTWEVKRSGCYFGLLHQLPGYPWARKPGLAIALQQIPRF